MEGGDLKTLWLDGVRLKYEHIGHNVMILQAPTQVKTEVVWNVW